MRYDRAGVEQKTRKVGEGQQPAPFAGSALLHLQIVLCTILLGHASAAFLRAIWEIRGSNSLASNQPSAVWLTWESGANRLGYTGTPCSVAIRD